MKKKIIINEAQAKKILSLTEQTKPNMGIDNLHPGRPSKKPFKPSTSKGGYDCKVIGDIGTKCVPHGLPNEEAYEAYGVYTPYSGWGNQQEPYPMFQTYQACLDSVTPDDWAYNNDSWECRPKRKPN